MLFWSFSEPNITVERLTDNQHFDCTTFVWVSLKWVAPVLGQCNPLLWLFMSQTWQSSCSNHLTSLLMKKRYDDIRTHYLTENERMSYVLHQSTLSNHQRCIFITTAQFRYNAFCANMNFLYVCECTQLKKRKVGQMKMQKLVNAIDM